MPVETKKRLSLCIVTKDDEEILPECLKGMEEVADEIIITDIGSKDKTVEAAEKAGAFVYRMKWRNDYGEAKNNCLDHAMGRWVLFLQPNETICGEQSKELVSMLANPNAEGYLLHMDNQPDICRITSPVQFLRLFRNRREYRFQYKAFERIPDEVLTNIEDSGIRIALLDGFDKGKYSGSKAKLLKKELSNQPDDSYLQYMYGIMLLNRQKYEESVGYFQNALQNVNFEWLFAPHLLKCLGWSFIYLQRYSEAMEVLNNGINAFPSYCDLRVIRGELYRQQESFDNAISDLKVGLEIVEQHNIAVPAPEIDVNIILEMLGGVYEQLSDYSQALSCYQQAREMNSTSQELLNKIAELSEKADSVDISRHKMTLPL